MPAPDNLFGDRDQPRRRPSRSASDIARQIVSLQQAAAVAAQRGEELAQSGLPDLAEEAWDKSLRFDRLAASASAAYDKAKYRDRVR